MSGRSRLELEKDIRRDFSASSPTSSAAAGVKWASVIVDLEDRLSSLEWCVSTDSGVRQCPVCLHTVLIGHAPSCLLEAARRRPA